MERMPFQELRYCSRAISLATKLSVESPRPRAGSSFQTGYYAEGFYDGVPFPSGVRVGRPWKDVHHRPLLVSGSFNVRGAFRGGRRRIRLQCLQSPSLCLFLTSKQAPRDADLTRLFEAYWNSTFCLQVSDLILRLRTAGAAIVVTFPCTLRRTPLC